MPSTRKPLVLADGIMQMIQSGDTLSTTLTELLTAGISGLEVDAFGRPRLWIFGVNSGTGSVLRMGAFTADGDPSNIPSEGIVVANANATGDPMDSSNWAIARIKATRFGIENCKAGAQYYIFRADETQLIMRKDDGTSVFSVQRASGNTVVLGTCTVGGQAVVVTNDSRLSDARTPTAHAASHAIGVADAVFPSGSALQVLRRNSANTAIEFASIGAPTETITSSEAIAAGAYVTKWSDAGTLKVKNADASQGIAGRATGYVLTEVTTPGDPATVYPMSGLNTGRSGMTVAARQYLSGTTPGAITEAAPSTTGYIVQFLGDASSAANLMTVYADPIVL
jgi:hypothetical protein